MPSSTMSVASQTARTPSSSSRTTRRLCLLASGIAAYHLVAQAFVAVSSTSQIASTRRVPQALGARSNSRLPRYAGGDDAEKVRNRLLSLLDDEELAKEVNRPEGKPMRGRLDEIIVQLERKNPTEEPVLDELLDGDWTVKYSGSYAPGLLSSPTRELALFLYGGGFSLGNALNAFSSGVWGDVSGLKVLSQTVRIADGRTVDAFADIEVLGQTQTLSYMAELTPLSGSRMSEEVTSVELPSPIGMVQPPLELRRTILVTYLDDEVMIVRDESGVPDVLVREKVDPPSPAAVEEEAAEEQEPEVEEAAVLEEEASEDAVEAAGNQTSSPKKK